MVQRQPAVYQQHGSQVSVGGLRRKSQSHDGTDFSRSGGGDNSGAQPLNVKPVAQRQPQPRTSNSGLPAVPPRTSLTGNTLGHSPLSNSSTPGSGPRQLPSLGPMAPLSGVVSPSGSLTTTRPSPETARDSAQNAFMDMLGQQQLLRSSTAVVTRAQLPALHAKDKGSAPLGTTGHKPSLAPLKPGI